MLSSNNYSVNSLDSPKASPENYGWHLVSKGRVRSIYRKDDHAMLVAGNDVSVGNRILVTNIPNRGRILTDFSRFWFERVATEVPTAYIKSHNILVFPDPRCCIEQIYIEHRIPLEAIVRGYLAGSAHESYARGTRKFCDHELPDDLRYAEKLSAPIFTPTTKASRVYNSRNLTREQAICYIKSAGFAQAEELYKQMEYYSIRLYQYAYRHALEQGVVIADTKFEFGIDSIGRLLLIDECLTPDSTRYWSRDSYAVGRPQYGFDKQLVRDFLREYPQAKELPPNMADKLSVRYTELLCMLKGLPYHFGDNINLRTGTND